MDARTSHIGFPVPEALPNVPDPEFLSASAELHVVLQTSNHKYPCAHASVKQVLGRFLDTTYSLLWSETRLSQGNSR